MIFTLLRSIAIALSIATSAFVFGSPGDKGPVSQETRDLNNLIEYSIDLNHFMIRQIARNLAERSPEDKYLVLVTLVSAIPEPELTSTPADLLQISQTAEVILDAVKKIGVDNPAFVRWFITKRFNAEKYGFSGIIRRIFLELKGPLSQMKETVKPFLRSKKLKHRLAAIFLLNGIPEYQDEVENSLRYVMEHLNISSSKIYLFESFVRLDAQEMKSKIAHLNGLARRGLELIMGNPSNTARLTRNLASFMQVIASLEKSNSETIRLIREYIAYCHSSPNSKVRRSSADFVHALRVAEKGVPLEVSQIEMSKERVLHLVDTLEKINWKVPDNEVFLEILGAAVINLGLIYEEDQLDIIGGIAAKAPPDFMEIFVKIIVEKGTHELLAIARSINICDKIYRKSFDALGDGDDFLP